MKERRYAPRVPLGTEARLRSGNRELTCKVVDVSGQGMAVETDADERLDRFVRSHVHLDVQAPPVDLDAIVIRSDRRAGRIRWALAFHQPPPHMLSQVSQFVQSLNERKESSDVPAAADGAEDPADQEVERLFDQALKELGS